jgi:AraC-like DNA-binding protein
MIPFYFFYSAEEKMQVDKGLIDDYNGVFSIILLFGFILSGITYSVLSYLKLLQRNKVVEENFSDSNNIEMNWLRYAILGIAAVFITAAIVIIFREVLDFHFPFNADILIYSLIVGFVVYVGYSGIRQQDLFSNKAIKEEELVKIESDYKRSSLKIEVAKKKHNELLELMKEEKPYLNPKLTLSELAKNLNISTTHLSQIINYNLNQHFFDFVNSYRIRNAMEILKNPEKKEFTILEILYEVGFNSKSSFNTAFKKHTNQTPTQFREKALKSAT